MILPALPGYSETFIQNKIAGLISNGNKVYLCVNQSKTHRFKFPAQVKVCSMVKVGNYIQICLSMAALILLKPKRCIKFIMLERKSDRQYLRIIKNFIISMHILKQPLDYVHFEFATMGINRENIAQAMGALSLVSFRGFDIGLFPQEHPNCYNLLFEKVDQIHTISDDLYQKALNLGLSKETAVTKIPPAIDTHFFQPSSEKQIHIPLRIMSVGRLEWKKGFGYLLDALHLLKEKGIEFTCRIIGDGSYYEAIQFSIYQLGLKKEVQLLGQQPPNEVKTSLDWADVYVQPSIQEGFCNAVLEAQAMGCFCIVTDAEGLSENVKNNETGLVVKRRSSKGIFNAILEMLDMHPEIRENIRQNAISRVQNNFNLSKQKNEFYQLYERVELRKRSE